MVSSLAILTSEKRPLSLSMVLLKYLLRSKTLYKSAKFQQPPSKLHNYVLQCARLRFQRKKGRFSFKDLRDGDDTSPLRVSTGSIRVRCDGDGRQLASLYLVN